MEGLPENVQGWLTTAMTVVTVASVVASVLNAIFRGLVEKGVMLPAWALTLGAGVNVLAANLDKATQLVRGYRGPSKPPAS